MISTIGKFKHIFIKKIKNLFGITNSTIDSNIINNIESLLISLDIGHNTSSYIIKKLKKQLLLKTYDKINENVVYELTKNILIDILNKYYSSLDFDYSSSKNNSFYVNKHYKKNKPFIFFVIGVNGVGKTTSIAKIAFLLKKYKFKIMLVAADTFRSAAIEQLNYWANEIKITIFKKSLGIDPASVVFDAIELAKKNNIDVVLIDTAGRLHNNFNLINQLLKIKKVITKTSSIPPDETSLVLDSNFGYNSLEQFKVFNDAIKVNSIILTKLDGVSHGGMIINIINDFKIPVKFVSFGEKLQDFGFFNKKKFVNSFFR